MPTAPELLVIITFHLSIIMYLCIQRLLSLSRRCAGAFQIQQHEAQWIQTTQTVTIEDTAETITGAQLFNQTFQTFGEVRHLKLKKEKMWAGSLFVQHWGGKVWMCVWVLKETGWVKRLQLVGHRYARVINAGNVTSASFVEPDHINIYRQMYWYLYYPLSIPFLSIYWQGPSKTHIGPALFICMLILCLIWLWNPVLESKEAWSKRTHNL